MCPSLGGGCSEILTVLLIHNVKIWEYVCNDNLDLNRCKLHNPVFLYEVHFISDRFYRCWLEHDKVTHKHLIQYPRFIVRKYNFAGDSAIIIQPQTMTRLWRRIIKINSVYKKLRFDSVFLVQHCMVYKHRDVCSHSSQV